MPCPDCGRTDGICEPCDQSIAVACRPDSLRELLKRWPPGGVAADCGVRLNVVSHWKRRERLPPQYWRRLIAGAARRGLRVTAEDLVRLHDIGPLPEQSHSEKPIASPGAAQAA